MTTDKQAALERAYELLDRLDIQCRAAGHHVGGIGELKAIYRQSLAAQPVADDKRSAAFRAFLWWLHSGNNDEKELEALAEHSTTILYCLSSNRAATAPKNCNSLVKALETFDEVMRSHCYGPDSEKHKARLLKGAHRKAVKALAAHRAKQEDKCSS